MNGELVAVNDEKQDFSECLSIEKSSSWQQCLTDVLSKMRFQDIDLESHDFSPGVDTEQEEEDERDKARGTYAAIAVPLTVAFPWVVATLCVFSCGACLDDPGAQPGGYPDSCIGDLQITLSAAVTSIQNTINRTEIIDKMIQLPHAQSVHSAGKSEQASNDLRVMYFTWRCAGMDKWLNVNVGLRHEVLEWAWFRFGFLSAHRSHQQVSLHDRKLSPYESRLKKGAEKGDAGKQLKLYWMLPTSPETTKWLCRAADQGHPVAQAQVGLLYSQGSEGLPKDIVKSFKWYQLAAANGSKKANDKTEEMQKGFTANQYQRLKALTRDWQPGQCERDITFK
jgi:hypothetical protein